MTEGGSGRRRAPTRTRARAEAGLVELDDDPAALGVKDRSVGRGELEPEVPAGLAEVGEPHVHGHLADPAYRSVVRDARAAHDVEGIRCGRTTLHKGVSVPGPERGQGPLEQQGVAGVVQHAHRVELVEVDLDQVGVPGVDGGGH
jgi:hypothetical protein